MKNWLTVICSISWHWYPIQNTHSQGNLVEPIRFPCLSQLNKLSVNSNFSVIWISVLRTKQLQKKGVYSRPFNNSCLFCEVVHVQTFGRYLRVELIPRTAESSMFFSSRKILLQTRLDCERFLNNIDFRILLLQHKTKGTMTKKK